MVQSWHPQLHTGSFALGLDAQLSSQHGIWVQAVSALERNTLLAGRGSLDLCVQNRESLHPGCISIFLNIATSLRDRVVSVSEGILQLHVTFCRYDILLKSCVSGSYAIQGHLKRVMQFTICKQEIFCSVLLASGVMLTHNQFSKAHSFHLRFHSFHFQALESNVNYTEL